MKSLPVPISGSPGLQPAGAALPGFALTACMALICLSNSSTFRPTGPTNTSTAWTIPSGSMMKRPLWFKPDVALQTPYARDTAPEGSEAIGYQTFLMVGDVFFHIQWEKCVSVLIEITSTRSSPKAFSWAATAPSSVGQTKVKSAG